jgi:SAM-dependent methyltransferase
MRFERPSINHESVGRADLMDYNGIVDNVNKSAYARAEVVDWYDDLEFILAPEKAILKKVTPVIKDKKLLDIGIGGGRTTRFLVEISKDYTGIDYTPRCVEIVKRKYPAATVLCCDARDLSAFSNETFDFVLFSFNAIDYIAHDDRIKALSEIHRVLKPGGLFMFSTHNRDYKHFTKLPWQEGIQFNLNYLKNCLYTLAHLPKHFRMKQHEIYTDEYAIINDNAHGFSLLAYYIGASKQIEQLKSTGFVDTEVYDMEGKLIDNDRDFPWTYYLTKKPVA